MGFRVLRIWQQGLDLDGARMRKPPRMYEDMGDRTQSRGFQRSNEATLSQLQASQQCDKDPKRITLSDFVTNWFSSTDVWSSACGVHG